MDGQILTDVCERGHVECTELRKCTKFVGLSDTGQVLEADIAEQGVVDKGQRLDQACEI